MSLSIGIVGLPNAGKSTLFNALLGRRVADTAPYPFCTIEPNIGVVEVPDGRLERLVEVIKPNRKIPAVIKFVDLAGLVKGAHKGEGLGNEFLSRIREVDVILHLVRAFDAPEVDRAGSVDPQTDIETVNTELVLKDLDTVSKVQDARTRHQNPERYALLEKVRRVLENGRFVSEARLSQEEAFEIKDLNLLTLKPILLVLNFGESKVLAAGEIFNLVGDFDAVSICAKLEEELSEFTPKERKTYLAEIGVSESGLDRIIKRCYLFLDLITFYTIKGGRIVQAWPIKSGSAMIEAAGLVHSDFAERFIRSEVIGVLRLIEAGSWTQAREEGLIGTRGRDYVVCDGDVIEFKI